MATPDLTQSIEQLARLKDEHRPILRQVAADPGMSPETRAALVEHLYEEEDEHVAELVALAQRGGARGDASDAPSDGARRKGRRSPHESALSVGSLRPGADAEPLQVGSLRPDYPVPARSIAGGTVSGALRTPPGARAPAQTAPPRPPTAEPWARSAAPELTPGGGASLRALEPDPRVREPASEAAPADPQPDPADERTLLHDQPPRSAAQRRPVGALAAGGRA